MGVHTGDSITVAPAQTLTDREYQALRDASLAVMRAIGVETGGAHVQFAVNPRDGRLVVIEMNPRVSRSSALASKATGFPIAKIAAKLAIGYTLDELPNDITRSTPACFEPALDYIVAVSYTHLDVYKRQGMLFNRREMAYLRAMLNGRKLEFRSPGAGAEWHAVRIFATLLIMNTMAPVSYTHLDVYKRQRRS